jgi:shikimate kinase
MAILPPDGRGPRPDRLLLVGMMGAGKSTVARLVAAKVRYPTVDTDELVARDEHMSVAEIFTEKGEDAFRAAESAVIARLANIEGPLVVSVGGGAVLRPENRRAMRSLGTVVWLRARPATLAARLGRGEGRPLLVARGSTLAPAETLSRLAAERHDLYQEVADVTIDVDELSPRQAAARVLVEIGRRRR